MKFINKGPDQQVRQEEPIDDKHGSGGFRWHRVRTGETIDLPRKVGLRHGFKKVTDVIDEEKPKVTEGKIGKKKVETKQIDLKKKT